MNEEKLSEKTKTFGASFPSNSKSHKLKFDNISSNMGDNIFSNVFLEYIGFFEHISI
jgi:hypothetical protein